MSQKKVVYVNQDDEVVGSDTIHNAYRSGYALRVVRIFIINPKGEILLQKRAKKEFSSSKWDQSAGGHVDEGETYLEAAKRELLEEMDIQDIKLIKVDKFYTEDQPYTYVRKRFNVLYYGIYNGPVSIDNDEVAGYMWISKPELSEWTKRNANEFTDGFLISYKKLLDFKIVSPE